MKRKAGNRKNHLKKLRQRSRGRTLRPFHGRARVRFTPMWKMLTPGSLGNAEIQHFAMTPLESSIHYHSEEALIMREMKEHCPHAPQKDCAPGKYTRLLINGETMMSDTPMERDTNQHVLEKAHGNVLIGGLGLGMLVIPLLAKPDVHKLIVVEMNPNVIELVGGQMPASPKLEVIRGDVFRWLPAECVRFHTIYFDIWEGINPSFLEDIEILKQRFEPYLDICDPHAWMGAWLENYYRWVRDLRSKDRVTKRIAQSSTTGGR